MVDTCPQVCQADLDGTLISNFTSVDLTNVQDTICNSVLLLTDDAGLQDVTDVASGDLLTAANRTQLVASLTQVADHFTRDSEVYRAAEEFFANSGSNGVASFFYLGLFDGAGTMVTSLDEIAECLPCFTHVAVVHELTDGTVIIDDAELDAVAQWAIANSRIAYLRSADPLTKNSADQTNLKARLFNNGILDVLVHYDEGQCEAAIDPVTGLPLTFAVGDPVVDANGDPVIDPETGVQRISDGTDVISEIYYPYTEFLTAGWAAGVDFTQSGSWYSLAYKPQGGGGFVGIQPSILNLAEVGEITGRLPDGSINPANNGYANVYVSECGQVGLREGISVGGSWIPQIHLNIFMKRQLKDAIAQLVYSRRVVAFDDAVGRAALVATLGGIMRDAQDNGLFTADPQNWLETGSYLDAGNGWVIRQDSFNDQSAARKNARLAPQVQVCFIPAGGVHFVPVTLCTLSVPQVI